MKNLLVLLLSILTQAVFAQTKLPVIKANTNKVSIEDGGRLYKNAWTLSPKAKPDIYIADRTRQTKWVIFYTDIDSIRLKVKPGSSQDFIILLNGHDSCYTRIQSAVPLVTNLTSSTRSDTIPFRLTAYNAIAIKAIINNKDTLNLHFDASSLGIHFLKQARKGTVNTLRIGTLEIMNPEISTTNNTAQEMDGRIGFDVFEGKQIELNYDQSIMVIHSRLPPTKGYTRSKLLFNNGFPCVKGSFKLGCKNLTGLFTLDNGSSTALVLDSGWAAKANIAGQCPLLHTSIIRDANGKAYETKIVQAPVFNFSRFELIKVPTTIFAGSTPFGYEVNFLGNDVLKRFNTIIDLKNDEIYFKENQLMRIVYRE